jgi:diguanylate cyclase (GGDEF)-like protein/PAS domain S-box-containing protein
LDINLLDLFKDSSLISFFVYQESGRIVFANRSFAKLIDRELDEIIGKTFFKFILQDKTEKLESEKIILRRIAGEDFVKELSEVNFLRKDKALISTYLTSYTIDFQGKKSGLAIIIDKSTEDSYKKLLTSLLKINQLLQNENNKESLIDSVCKVLVEEIGYFIAVFGKVDENKLFNPISTKTKDKKISKSLELFLKNYKISVDSNKIYGRGSISEAYHTKDISLRVNVSSNPNHSYWVDFYKKHNIESLCAIPVVRDEKVEYIILILDTFKGSFSLENLNLLEELKRDLSFAFEKIERDSLLNIMKQAIDQTHEWVLITDKNTNILFVNDSVLKISGYSRKELMGKNPNIFKSGLIQEEIYKNMWNRLSNKKAFKHVFVDKAKDGHIFYLDVLISPIIENEKIEYYISLGRDVTELVRYEEENKKKQNQINLMIEGLPNPAWLIENYRIIYQNKAAETIFKSNINGYCWNEIYKSKFITNDQTSEFKNAKAEKFETSCSFCLLKSAHKEKKAKSCLVNFNGKFFETWWVPVAPDKSLHYAIDVTRYKTMEKKLKEISNTDYLTGLPNRRYFIEKLQEEIERYRRSNLVFSMVMLDLDHFKRINDIYGHDMGDRVLVGFCNAIKKRLRKIDTFARFGGEEFMIILPNTDIENAIILSEDLRSLTSKLKINDIKFTVSIGIVEACSEDTVDTLIKSVDNMLYEAKNSGRNCIKFKKFCN